MPDYSKGKIYTLRCRTDDTLIYVGSTIQSLAVRLGGHKKNSRQERQKNRLIFTTINDDWDNWYIELYELYPCSCKEQLCKREGEVIRLIGTLNNNIAGRTNEEYQKEYRDENRDKKKEINKKYRENNADKIKEYQKEYQKENRDKIKEYNKLYRLENVDKVKEYNKQHYLEKKKAEKLNIINTY